MTDFTWDGGGDGTSWSDPANWDVGSGFPDDNGDRAIFNATADAVVTEATRTIGELQINSGFTGSLTVTGGALTIDDAGAHDGSFNIDAGTFDANDLDVNIDGDFDTGGGTTIMGVGSVWTCGGNWNSNAGTKAEETSKVKLTGTGKTFVTGLQAGDALNIIEITGTITVGPGDVNTGGITADLIVSGTLTIPTGRTWNGSGGDLSISSSGNITGAGQLTWGGSITQMDGVLDITTFNWKPGTNLTITIVPGTYGPVTFTISRTSDSGGARTARFNAGTFIFEGDVVISQDTSAGELFTLDMGTNNPTVEVKGDYTINIVAGTFTYTHSSNPLKFTGTALQTVTSDGEDLGFVEVTNTAAGGVTFADAVNMDKLTAAATSASILIKFDETGAHTVDEFALSGTGAFRVQLRSEVDANQWDVTTVGDQAVDHADVKDSNMSGGTYTVTDGTDSGNNSANWVFAAAGARRIFLVA